MQIHFNLKKKNVCKPNNNCEFFRYRFKSNFNKQYTQDHVSLLLDIK